MSNEFEHIVTTVLKTFEGARIMATENGKYTEVGAAWKRESKKGTKYLSVSITKDIPAGKYVAFVNKFKKQDNHPDFRIYEDRENPNTTTTETTDTKKKTDPWD